MAFFNSHLYSSSVSGFWIHWIPAPIYWVRYVDTHSIHFGDNFLCFHGYKYYLLWTQCLKELNVWNAQISPLNYLPSSLLQFTERKLFMVSVEELHCNTKENKYTFQFKYYGDDHIKARQEIFFHFSHSDLKGNKEPMRMLASISTSLCTKIYLIP